MTIKINKDLAVLGYLPDLFLLKGWRRRTCVRVAVLPEVVKVQE
jgi:hypothetical protein